MCPASLIGYNPAANILLDYATNGCQASMGRSWMQVEIQVAIERGNHETVKVCRVWQQLYQEEIKKA